MTIWLSRGSIACAGGSGAGPKPALLEQHEDGLAVLGGTALDQRAKDALFARRQAAQFLGSHSLVSGFRRARLWHKFAMGRRRRQTR